MTDKQKQQQLWLFFSHFHTPFRMESLGACLSSLFHPDFNLLSWLSSRTVCARQCCVSKGILRDLFALTGGRPLKNKLSFQWTLCPTFLPCFSSLYVSPSLPSLFVWQRLAYISSCNSSLMGTVPFNSKQHQKTEGKLEVDAASYVSYDQQ